MRESGLGALCILPGLFLGSGCRSVDFGEPSFRFDVDGQVLSALDKLPIKGIQVALGRPGDKDTSYSSSSDGQGRWSIKGTYWNDTTATYSRAVIHARDLDGEENSGYFRETTVPAELQKTEESNGRFDQGRFERHGVVVQMERGLPDAGHVGDLRSLDSRHRDSGMSDSDAK